ncbi:MAG: hypothetical protein AAF567_12780 [Actinomycetota bacterium]
MSDDRPTPLDASSRFIDLVTGRRRAGPVPTLLIALVVTAAVVIPLGQRVLEAEETRVADAASIVVDIADAEPGPLDGAILRGGALVSVTDTSALGVSFQLFEAGGTEPLLASQDVSGPEFFLVETAAGRGRTIDTTVLDDGGYELFVTIATSDGDERTAVGFTVDNS